MNQILEQPLALPLRVDSGGTIRVGQTRVSLDSLIWAFRRGSTPEETVQQYPSVQLADIYVVFALYLRHQEEVDAYMLPRQLQAEALERQAAASGMEFRERLLARQRQAQS